MRADRIIAVSEETKRDIIKRLNVDPDKIDVIKYGCHPRYTEKVSESRKIETKERYKLPDKYVLTENPHKRYKNLELTIRALAQLPEDVHYVVVGKRTRHTSRLEDIIYTLKLNSRVHFIEDAKLEDLPAIYSQAKVYVTTSRHSGFSSSIVKALHIGIPVIASTGTSHEEAGGEDSIYVSPNDYKELAIKINTLLTDEALYDKIVRKGFRFAQQFRKEVVAYNLISCYKRIGVDLTQNYR